MYNAKCMYLLELDEKFDKIIRFDELSILYYKE